MSPLQELQQKIIKAVPDINSVRFVLCQDKLETVNFGCPEEYHKTSGRNIGLEDVLIALGKEDKPLSERINIDETGQFGKRCVITENFKWLLNTPLHLQSEETISALNKLIK